MLQSVGISKGEVLASVGICGGASAGVDMSEVQRSER